jgi:hypothetical protein
MGQATCVNEYEIIRKRLDLSVISLYMSDGRAHPKIIFGEISLRFRFLLVGIRGFGGINL